MSRKKVLELAVLLKIKVSDILMIANTLDIPLKNAMSSLDESQIQLIKDSLHLINSQKTPNLGTSTSVKTSSVDHDSKNKDKAGLYKGSKEIINKESKNKKTNQIENKTALSESSKKKFDSRSSNKKNSNKNFISKKKQKERQLLEKKFIDHTKSKEVEKVDLNIAKKIKIKDNCTVGDLSKKMGIPVSEIIKYLFSLGVVCNINTNLDRDTLDILALEYKCDISYEEQLNVENLENLIQKDRDDQLIERPPVVTIMGHVDHGKTTLLDTIRKSKVVDAEHGGITQHIGAYEIVYNNKRITFIDTPGHEAFTQMRSRGAQLTDIVIIIVAADDGVKPQTKEAIDHAKAADVPIIVVINKIDKENCNIEKVMQELSEYGLQPESWGGDTLTVKISAKTNTNIDELLETILLVAEMRELKGNPDKLAHGRVLEASLDKGLGPISTLLIQGGTLEQGNFIVVGGTYGKIRTIFNDQNDVVKKAYISSPVLVTGLQNIPEAGDTFITFDNEKTAKYVAQKRKLHLENNKTNKNKLINLDELNKKINSQDIDNINIIVRADVKGSAEALVQSLLKIEQENIKIKVVREAVGSITESDIMLASATNSIIYGFNIRISASIRNLADSEGVDIRLYTIIYDAVEDFQRAVQGKLSPTFEEVVIGHLEVRQLFKISKIGTIAGCKVLDGEVIAESNVRLLRDSCIIYTGKLASLKREKNDVKSVQAGFECGATIEGYNDIKVNDIIEVYKNVELEI